MIRRFFAAPQTNSRGATLIRRTLIACAVGFFAAAAALGMVPRSEPQAPVQHLITRPLPLKPADIRVGSAGSAPFVSETRIRRGDTLAAVLQRLDAYDPKLLAFLTQDASARSIYKLYPGRTVRAATDDQGNLAWLRYVHTPDARNDDSARSGTARLLVVESDGQGGYTAHESAEDTTTRTNLAVGVIRSSLFAATDEAGIPDAITLQIADILGAKIDFLHDLREGDRFRVVYETRQHEGRYAGAGRVLAVQFVNDGKPYNAVWFSPDPDSGTGAYYDFDGMSLRGAFLRTALKFTRISSTFGMRMHPLHKIWTTHKGVDYAAPTGTPIHATADGVVEFAGWQNGYGNVVILKHYGNYSTVYAHQSRIADGLRKGDKVSQDQVIGYVGATGWATGPHLHYEFRVDNRPVDPLSVDLPVARALDPGERSAFMHALAPYRRQIRMLARMPGQRSPESDHVASL